MPSNQSHASALEVRPVRSDDLDEVSALLARTWHATYDGIYGADRVVDITGRWHCRAALAEGLGRPDGCFLVAVSAGRIIGTASARLTCAGSMKLDRLYVDPQMQGRGTGSRLLDACLASHAAASSVTLEVEPRNTGAIAFYERHGFSVTGRTGDCGCSGDGIPALVMTRLLAAAPAAPSGVAGSSSHHVTRTANARRAKRRSRDGSRP